MFCRFHMFFSDTFWKLPKSSCSFKFFTQRKKHFLVSYFVSIIYLVLNVILLNNKTAPAISPMQCPFVHKYFPCWSVDKREGMLWISMGQTVTGGHHSSILGDTDIEETGTLLCPVPLWMHLIQHIYTGRISDVVSYKFVQIITHVV